MSSFLRSRGLWRMDMARFIGEMMTGGFVVARVVETIDDTAAPRSHLTIKNTFYVLQFLEKK